MTIYDKAKIKCRTFIESINILFNMGKDLETEVGGKQETLVSGTNIKTINGGSVLGEGNLVIVGDTPAVESGDAGKALAVNSDETAVEWTGDIKVSDTPLDDEYAVNSFYVNDSTGTVENNIVHKDGDETINGVKTIDGLLKHPMIVHDGTVSNTSYDFVKLCDIDDDSLTLLFDSRIMGFYFDIFIHLVKEASVYANGYIEIRGNKMYIDSLTKTDVFTILNSTTGKTELWLNVRPGGRIFYYLEKASILNDSSDASIITVYCTRTNTDPYGTPDYQTDGVNNPKSILNVILTPTVA